MDDPEAPALVPLAGGWSGETFLAEAAGEQTVVRIYRRDPGRGEVDAALLRLVRGLLPVPEVLELRPPHPAAATPAVLVTALVPGGRGDLLLPTLDDAGLAAAGRAVGEAVAALGGMPMLTAGPFVDDLLTVGSFGGPDAADGLPGYVEAREPDLAHLRPEELAGLREVAVDAQVLLDTVARRCLVHGDLNPKNLLLDPDSLRLTAVLDWEFAHAGHPFTDLGNALRFDRAPAYADALLTTYAGLRDVAPEAALALARAADLWSLIDLAARRHAHPVAARADRLLRAVARHRDPGTDLPD